MPSKYIEMQNLVYEPPPYSIVVNNTNNLNNTNNPNNPNKSNDCNLCCECLIGNLCYIITCCNCDCLDYLNKKIINLC